MIQFSQFCRQFWGLRLLCLILAQGVFVSCHPPQSSKKQSDQGAPTSLEDSLGKEFRDRPTSTRYWRIRLVDQKDLWHNVLFMGNKIETPYGSPGEYYVDQKNIKLEADLYALMEGFMAEEE